MGFWTNIVKVIKKIRKSIKKVLINAVKVVKQIGQEVVKNVVKKGTEKVTEFVQNQLTLTKKTKTMASSKKLKIKDEPRLFLTNPDLLTQELFIKCRTKEKETWETTVIDGHLTSLVNHSSLESIFQRAESMIKIQVDSQNRKMAESNFKNLLQMNLEDAYSSSLSLFE